MVTVTVCVGSSCFLRGSADVIEEFRRLAESLGTSQVEIKGSFCMDRCTNGVTVKIDDTILTGVSAGQVETLFRTYVLPKLK